MGVSTEEGLGFGVKAWGLRSGVWGFGVWGLRSWVFGFAV